MQPDGPIIPAWMDLDGAKQVHFEVQDDIWGDPYIYIQGLSTLYIKQFYLAPSRPLLFLFKGKENKKSPVCLLLYVLFKLLNNLEKWKASFPLFRGGEGGNVFHFILIVAN